ncbi:MAG: SPOR domain-containing protein [Parabacteroides sp.]
MLRIVTHIEQLLLANDHVVIPQVGGLVLAYKSTTLCADTVRFVPVHRAIVFDPTLSEDDGLLLKSYQHTYGLNEKYARRMLLGDIGLFRSTLQKRGEVTIGSIGRLTRSGSKFVFYGLGEHTFDAETYGLPVFQFPLLPVEPSVETETPHKRVAFSFFDRFRSRSVQTSPSREETDVAPQPEVPEQPLPLKWRVLQAAAVSAAAVALFLLVSTPVEDVKISTYRASLIPTERIAVVKEPMVEIPAPVVEESVATTAEEPVVEKTIVDKPIVDKPVEEKPVVETKPAVTKKAVATPVRSGKKYYVVIGSFPNEAQANKFIKQLDKSQYKEVGKVVRGYKCRVYAAQYDQRDPAEQYLEQVRKNPKYKDAWLFISR